jgi:outer membrane protein
LAPINASRVFTFGLLLLLASTVLCAQSATEATGTKIGVVNVQQAIAASGEGKQAAAELQTQLLPRQQEIESLTKQLNDLQQRLNTDATLNDADRSRLSVQGTRSSQRLDRKTNDYQEDVNAARSEILNRIGGKMMNVINRYAQEGNYVAIFDSSAQNSSLLFAAKNVDITQDIIRLYDQANPVKGASSTPATPTTKPAPAPKPVAPLAAKPQ